MRLLTTLITLFVTTATFTATAAPITLFGMGIQKQWTDTETLIDEMPDFVWGNSDTDGANSIGLHVLFEDGTEGSIAYTDIAAHWNTNGSAFGTLLGATGFFANYAGAGLHFLYNTAATNTYPQALPIAWINNPTTPFGSNVELDYNESNNSEFRIATQGWDSVQITTYSDTAPGRVPEPGTLALIGLGLAGLGYKRRKA